MRQRRPISAISLSSACPSSSSNQPALRTGHGATGSYSSDHAEAVPPQFYSRCTARQGQDNTMLHKAPQFHLPSLAPPYTNTRSTPKLGHLVAHIALITPDTLLSVPSGLHTGTWPKAVARPQHFLHLHHVSKKPGPLSLSGTNVALMSVIFCTENVHFILN